MDALELVTLTALMERGGGRPEVRVGLIDGPVALDHPDLASRNIVQVPGRNGACSSTNSLACIHGTFIAGILHAKRGGAAPAICPDCTLLVRPIFPEAATTDGAVPSAVPDELASAIVETIDAGACVVNMSLGLSRASAEGERRLNEALDYAASRGVIVAVAAGNQGIVGSSVLTGHPWAIPVAACNLCGEPINVSNLGPSIGRRGLSAPGENIVSLGADGKPRALHGTSAATPFVTGAVALLWSEFPKASATEIKRAVAGSPGRRRKTIVPPVLDARAAYRTMLGRFASGG